MKFQVLEVSEEEYMLAESDWTYSPQEYVAGVIEAETEVHAQLKLSRYIKAGTYSITAQLKEMMS